jgi:hypothetical protein
MSRWRENLKIQKTCRMKEVKSNTKMMEKETISTKCSLKATGQKMKYDIIVVFINNSNRMIRSLML